MERPALTIRFVIGVILIITSLVLGKLILIPLLLFPVSANWRIAMISVYIFSWIILLIGIYISGIETYNFIKFKYDEYGQRTIHNVRRHGRAVARHTAKAFHPRVKSAKSISNLKFK